MSKWLILIALCLGFLPARGQQARVAGLEGDSLYMELLSDELAMQHAEDSLAGLLAQTRLQLRQVDNQDFRSLGEHILTLEAQLLQLRGELGLLSSKINTIEQRYVMDNIFARSLSAQGMDDYLRTQLSDEDHAAWRQAAAGELAVYDFMKSYLANYFNIRDLALEYELAATQPVADSLYARYVELRRFAGVMSDTIATLWGSIYDTKSYLCDLVMDKAANRIYMERLQERIVRLEGAKAALGDDLDSPVVSYYAPEKQFVLSSELAVADYLADHPRADSLRSAIATLEGMMPLPQIALAPKIFEEPERLDARGRPLKKPAAKPDPTNYRIEIVSRQSTLPPEVRTLLEEWELSRAASSDAGGELYTFILVVTQGKQRAGELAAAVRAALPTLIVQVNPITND